MFNDENLSEVENGIQFVGFIRDVECNSVIVSGFAEGEEREDMFSVACMEILTFTEALEEKAFVESAKAFVWDSVTKLDIAKLEDFSVRVDTTAELLISCSTEIVVPSSREIDTESLERYVEDIREEFFASRLLSVEWDSLVVFDETLLFVLLANGDWLIKGVEIVVMAPENCKDVSLALLDTDGEAITTEETGEVLLWIVDWIKELAMPGSLIWLELLVVVVGVPEETLPLTVDKDDIFWVGLCVAPTCGLGALCDVALSSCEEIYKEN